MRSIRAAPAPPAGNGLNRSTLAQAALDLIQSDGLPALTMRTLADRIGVKASSLYWHVRDRDELLELVADALLARIPSPPAELGWRERVLALCEATVTTLASQRDGGRILLGTPAALRRSATAKRVVGALLDAGVEPGLAVELVAMLLGFAASKPVGGASEHPPVARRPLRLAIDAGSRGVVVRAGQAMETPFFVPHDPAVAAPAVLRGERVIVRRLRGSRRGEVTLNPAHPWRVQVRSPSWNTLLDLSGLDLRELQIDSGASGVECLLPRPRGVVPLHISSGALRVTLKRPPGSAVIASVAAGAVQVSLDDYRPRVTVGDVLWATPDASNAPDRYELRISGGAVRIGLAEAAESVPQAEPTVAAPASDETIRAALETVLDGVEQRRARSAS